MDLRLKRIDALKKSFDTHPSVGFLGAKLVTLTMSSSGVSEAKVSAIAKHEFMVHSDLKSGLITQGGLSFAIANFAGVYAAMVHTEKHTPLYSVEEIRYLGPIREGDEIIACATARRTDDLFIDVHFTITDKEFKQKLCGHLRYRDDKKK